MSQPEPRWDICYEVGTQAELWVSDIRKSLQSGTIEVKYDRRACEDRPTGNVYVEYACKKRGGKYKPSGIATTEAQLWVFVLRESELAIVVSTERLKELARKARDENQKASQDRGSYMSLGVYLRIKDIVQ